LSALELVAAALGLASCALAARNKPASWPFGIVSSAAYAVVFWRARLAVSLALQVADVATSAYGWFAWTRHGATGGTRPIRRLGEGRLVGIIAAALLASGVLGFALRRASPAPWSDATVGAFALAAMAVMALRYVECWYLWTVANLVGAALYARQQLYATALLWLVFQALAVAGLLGWRRELRRASG
jgi:nicotinamide mononucleotide transporter